MKYIRMGIILIFGMLLFGCDPPEGVELYDETFEKMTVKEKIIYEQVQDSWGYQRGSGQTDQLGLVRESIRRRFIKPPEEAMEFIDIKDVIISTNDTTFVSSSGGELMDSYQNAKFENVSSVWYKKLISSEQVLYNNQVSGNQDSKDKETFKFSNDLMLDCDKGKVILYIGRKLYYVAEEDEWGDYKSISCGGG
jgi:hypothetical protein